MGAAVLPARERPSSVSFALSARSDSKRLRENSVWRSTSSRTDFAPSSAFVAAMLASTALCAMLISSWPTDSTPLAKTVPESTQASTFRSEEHTSELQSLMRISYAVFCLKNKKHITIEHKTSLHILYKHPRHHKK